MIIKESVSVKISSEIKRPKILIIDDDTEYVNNLIFLIDGSYRFKSAAGSREGLELLKKEAFDLLILDLKMPAYFARNCEDEGIEVLRKIRNQKNKIRPDIPVFILTGDNSEERANLCKRMNANAYFIKPPKIQLLKKCICKFTT